MIHPKGIFPLGHTPKSAFPLGQMSGTNLVRFEVHFHIQAKGLDKTIKRAVSPPGS